jgi:hypothetical protein
MPKITIEVNEQTRWFLERPELRLFGENTEEVAAFLIQQQLGTLLVKGGILHDLLGQAPRGKPKPEATPRKTRRR